MVDPAINSDPSNTPVATLWRRENGNWVLVKAANYPSGQAPLAGSWYKLKVDAVGTSITCYIATAGGAYQKFFTVSDPVFTRGRVWYSSDPSLTR